MYINLATKPSKARTILPGHWPRTCLFALAGPCEGSDETCPAPISGTSQSRSPQPSHGTPPLRFSKLDPEKN